MKLRRVQSDRYARWVFAAVCVTFAAAVFVLFFEQLPIEGTSLALDWGGLYWALRDGLRYDITDGLRNPPWSVLPLLPLGLFSMRAGWGLLIFLTYAVLVFSVPRTAHTRRYRLSVLILAVSFPTLRHAADGNFEILTLAGILLIVEAYHSQNPYALAGGVLLASAKPHESVLLLPALAVYVLQTWPRRVWVRSALTALAVVVPTMLWRGGVWIQAVANTYQRGSILDISLVAALDRAGVSSVAVKAGFWAAVLGLTLYIAWVSDRRLTREKAALLVAASLLISPYAAGNNVLVVLAIGVIPLFQVAPVTGGALLALVNLPFLFSRDMLYYWQAYYWTIYLLLCWAILCRRVYRGLDTPIFLLRSSRLHEALNETERARARS